MYVSVPCLEVKAHFKQSGNYANIYNRDQMLRAAGHIIECLSCAALAKAYAKGVDDMHKVHGNTDNSAPDRG